MFFKRLKQNWQSGLTVALVAIPLSLSLAVASHATPLQGIITAIWAGLIASLFAGSNYNIIGPTGALSGVVGTFALMHGPEALPMLAIVAGVLIFIAYLAKLEHYLVFVPSSTLQGFIMGVACIIAFNQLNFALGLSGLPQHEKLVENVAETFLHIGATSLPTLGIFLVFFGGLFALGKLTPKFPGAITLTPIGLLIGYLSTKGMLPFHLQTLGERFGNISPVPFQAPEISLGTYLLVPALTIAIVAILETMISAKVADGMTRTKHHKRKEMFALSLANIGSGLMGGIPATAALARTSVNIKNGANHKISATFASIFTAVISILLIGYFQYIPLAVIGAILFFVAFRMVEVHHIIRMFKVDRRNFIIAILVAIITIYEDPIVGILFGTAVALILFVEKLSHGQFELVINDENKKVVGSIAGESLENLKDHSHTLVYSIKGELAYLNAEAHIARFEHNLGDYDNIVLRLRELYFIDLDGVDAFEEIVQIVEAQGKQVFVTGISPLIEKMLEDSKSFVRLRKKGNVYQKTSQALSKLGYPDLTYKEVPVAEKDVEKKDNPKTRIKKK